MFTRLTSYSKHNENAGVTLIWILAPYIKNLKSQENKNEKKFLKLLNMLIFENVYTIFKAAITNNIKLTSIGLIWMDILI